MEKSLHVSVVCRVWDDGGLVFNRASGYTHALDIVTMRVLLEIESLQHQHINFTKSTLPGLIKLQFRDLDEECIDEVVSYLSKLLILFTGS